MIEICEEIKMVLGSGPDAITLSHEDCLLWDGVGTYEDALARYRVNRAREEAELRAQAEARWAAEMKMVDALCEAIRVNGVQYDV